MMRTLKGLLVILCASLVLWASSAQQASAAGSPGRSGPIMTAGGGNCDKYSNSNSALLGKIIPCLAFTIEDATIKMARGFSNLIRPIFYAFLTLVVTFFGVKLLQGEQDLQKQAILLALKIGFVVVFINNFAGLTPYVYDVMKEGQEIVASAIAPTAIAAGNIGIVNVKVTMNNDTVHCDINKYDPGGAGGVIWAQMDCLLGKIMGFTVGQNGGPNMLLAASALGMLGGVLFGGTFGFAVFFAMIGFIFSLFSFVLKTAFAFINGYILAGIYIIISPLFIPLALLKVTNSYFESWWKGLLAALLMPVMVTGYAVFAMQVYDRMLLAPDSMMVQLFDHEIFKDAARNCTPRPLLGGSQTNDAVSEQAQGAQAIGNGLSNIVGFSNPTACTPNYEWGRLSQTGDSDKKVFVELMLEAAKLLILAMIMGQGLERLTSSISQITGKSSSSAVLSPQAGMERNIVGSVDQARTDMNRVMNARPEASDPNASQMGPAGATGALFVSRLPDALKAGGSGFLDGLIGRR
jgi:hypothetical protein